MGYALAAAAVRRGWEVDLVSGPVELDPPSGVNLHRVVTGQEMYAAVASLFPSCDILIMTAAIMDYRPRVVSDHKIKKNELQMVIEMEPVVDVLATVSRQRVNQLIVGFAAETNNIETYALDKLRSKNTDFIVANKIGGSDSAFGRDDNTILVYGRDGKSLSLGPSLKTELAGQLLDLFEPRIGQPRAVC